MLDVSSNVLWGVTGFVLGAFSGSFLSAAGKDVYELFKQKIKAKLKSEHEVPPDFKSQIYAVQNCAWIPEENLKNKESHNWQYHPHPIKRGKCFRRVGEGKFSRKEYFMVTPNANRV